MINISHLLSCHSSVIYFVLSLFSLSLRFCVFVSMSLNSVCAVYWQLKRIQLMFFFIFVCVTRLNLLNKEINWHWKKNQVDLVRSALRMCVHKTKKKTKPTRNEKNKNKNKTSPTISSNKCHLLTMMISVRYLFVVLFTFFKWSSKQRRNEKKSSFLLNVSSLFTVAVAVVQL